MLRPFLFISSLLLTIAAPLGAFDFTPRTMEVSDIDGNVFKIPYFRSGNTYHRLDLHLADLRGDASEAIFTYPSLQQATMRLRSHPSVYKDVGDITPALEQKLTEIARSYAPDGATPLEESTVEPCMELHPRGIPACEVVTHYDLSGNRIWQSVIFLTFLPNEPMVMVTTSYEKHAEDARRLSLRVIRAWQETTEDDLRKPPVH